MRAFLPRAVLRLAQLFQSTANAREPPKKKRERRAAPPPLSAIILNERKDALDEPNKLKRGAKRGFKKVSEDGKVDSRADRINFRPRGPSILKSSEKCIIVERARN
jgi:hypothetical protein